jgi:hypothetical protein
VPHASTHAAELEGARPATLMPAPNG